MAQHTDFVISFGYRSPGAMGLVQELETAAGEMGLTLFHGKMMKPGDNPWECQFLDAVRNATVRHAPLPAVGGTHWAKAGPG